MTAAVGTLGLAGIDTVNPVTVAFEFMSESLIMNEALIDANGVLGTRSRDQERVRIGLEHVGGTMDMQPTALEWSRLLAWCLGGTTSGSPTVTYTLGETLSTRFISIDRVTKVFTYAGCAVDTMTIAAAQGAPLHLTLGLVGTTETVAAAGTFPAITCDRTTAPFVFMDAALTISSVVVTPKSFEITVENHIDRERFFNSRTLSGAIALDRMVRFRCSVPYESAAQYALYGAGAVGVVLSAIFTNGSQVLTINMPSLAFPKRSPSIPGRVEVMLALEGTAYRIGGVSELSIALNPGP